MKGKMLFLTRLTIFFVVMGLVFINGIMQTQAQPKVVHWKGQNEFTEDDFPGPGVNEKGNIGIAGSDLATWVKDISKGRLVIELSAPGSMVPALEGLKAVGAGAIDIIALSYGGYYSGAMPEANFEVGPPYAWLTIPELYEFMHLRGGYKIIHEAYLERNVYWVPVGFGGPYGILSKPKLSSVRDLKGVKIRAPGIMGNFFKEFGASPTLVPAAETYMALKLGTIDAAYIGVSQLRGLKLQEVVQYAVYQPVPISTFCCILINLDKWKALPSDIREMIERNIRYFTLSITEKNEAYSWHCLYAAEKQATVQPIAWPNTDLPLIMEKALPLWDKIGSVNARCAKLLNIVKDQARAWNRIK